jgi:outer membrane lipoprotein-sorting protein
MLDRGKGKAEQHIYLPGLRRTRRIVGREREGSFMGSDFSYSDLRPVDADQADHKRLPDEKIGGDDTYVIESHPEKSADAGYSKIVSWVRKKDFVPLRTRFYTSDGKLKKTLYARRVKEMEGRPVVVEARMQNENGHATVMIVESMQRQDDIPDSSFTPSALER